MPKPPVPCGWRRTPRHRLKAASIPASARWRITRVAGARRPPVVAPRIHVAAVDAAAECLDVVEEQLVRARDYLLDRARLGTRRSRARRGVRAPRRRRRRRTCRRRRSAAVSGMRTQFRCQRTGAVPHSCSTRELCLSVRVAFKPCERYQLCTALRHLLTERCAAPGCLSMES